jgi:RNA polymerase sigma-32 factor
MRYVVAIALKYRQFSASLPDLISEGRLGLLHAFANYRLDSGCRLLTYSAYCIRAFIVDSLIRSRRETDGKLHTKAYNRLRRERTRMQLLMSPISTRASLAGVTLEIAS